MLYAQPSPVLKRYRKQKRPFTAKPAPKHRKSVSDRFEVQTLAENPKVEVLLPEPPVRGFPENGMPEVRVALCQQTAGFAETFLIGQLIDQSLFFQYGDAEAVSGQAVGLSISWPLALRPFPLAGSNARSSTLFASSAWDNPNS